MKNLFTILLAVLITAGVYSQVQFGTVTDVDNNAYKTVKIGSQVWMAENLRVTHYKNGDPLPNVTDFNATDSSWRFITKGAYCVYNNDSSMAPIYGNLYNYRAAVDERGLAPEGWHVATQEDWATLFQTLNPDMGADTVHYYAGIQLKEAGTEYWNTTTTAVTNPWGWSGRGAGYRTGLFGGLKTYSYMMRIPPPEVIVDPSVTTTPYPILIGMHEGGSMRYENSTQPWGGWGVRCVKNDTIFVITGIKESGNNLSFSVYPNPTAGTLKLRIENYDIKNLKYHIYAINGTLFQSTKVVDNETLVSIEKFVPGVYFMKVTDNNKVVKTFKIIKN